LQQGESTHVKTAALPLADRSRHHEAMRLAQVAVWVRDLEAMRAFYQNYFGAHAGDKYTNERKRFESYFLTFPGGGQIELMRRPDIADRNHETDRIGLAHLGLEVESDAAVDALTNLLCGDGHRLADGPRRTGDGYYESIVLDPEGNRILIVSGG
jgi:lactoylglutathione lyase